MTVPTRKAENLLEERRQWIEEKRKKVGNFKSRIKESR